MYFQSDLIVYDAPHNFLYMKTSLALVVLSRIMSLEYKVQWYILPLKNVSVRIVKQDNLPMHHISLATEDP